MKNNLRVGDLVIPYDTAKDMLNVMYNNDFIITKLEGIYDNEIEAFGYTYLNAFKVNQNLSIREIKKEFLEHIYNEIIKNIEVNHVSHLSHGHGHKKIMVELRYNNCFKIFTSITDNMPRYDEIMKIENFKEKEKALFGMIELNIREQLKDWIYELNNKD